MMMHDDILQGVVNINSKGFGTIPKLVMQDTSIHVVAKAIYAYFNSYAGGGNQCFPSRKKICNDLGISNDTFGKYLKQLTEHNYIKVEQVKENGRFSHNVYTLLDTILPCTEISDTEEIVHGNLDTNINSININRSNNNNKDTYIEIKQKFTEICVSLPKIIDLNPARKTAIRARLKEYSFDDIITVFQKAEKSDFLTGKVSNKNGSKPFKASFDWLMKPSNFIKVLEGNYDNRNGLSDFGLIGADERYRGIQII